MKNSFNRISGIFKKLLFYFVIVIFLPGINLYAQNDYEIVQNFKQKQLQIEETIENADSLEQLKEAEKEIEHLIENFKQNKNLLDNSLYPDDFDNSIDRLKNQLAQRKKDFTKLDVLKAQVTELEDHLGTLNQINNELIDQVSQLEEQTKKDKETIVQLEKNLSELKASLQKRDDLVMTMIDSLIPASYPEENLSSEQKQNILEEAKKKNIISNIKKSIQDNIRFLEITRLNPYDIESIRKREQEFARLWRSIGPRIMEIYSEKGENVNHLKEIDSAFTQWNRAIINEAWNTIRGDFARYNISLPKFTSGEEFTETLNNYIDDEIKSIGLKGREESEVIYYYFIDSVWFAIVEPLWLPYLFEHNMLNAAQQDSIKNQIIKWDEKLHPETVNWTYIIIGILAVLIIILIFSRKKAKETRAENKSINSKSGSTN